MKGKQFTYRGETFVSEGRFTADAMTNMLANDFKGRFELPGYSHADFYEAAKNADAYDDMFKVVSTGQSVIPCGGGMCIV